MSAVAYRFIEPLDVLMLRGNVLFGEAGSYADTQMPPWPSVMAGALRTRMLADEQMDLNVFAAGLLPAHVSLGSPAEPGPFVLQEFQVARRNGTVVEVFMPPPSDLVIREDDSGAPKVQALQPDTLHPALACSSGLAQVAILAQTERFKAASGWWLTQAGWSDYLRGHLPQASQLEHSSTLWRIDERIGVGLSRDTRSADNGKLFTSRAVAMQPGVGFLAGVSGADDATVPNHGALRLGGDGRAAAIRTAAVNWPKPDLAALCQQGRCRMVLTSPAVFDQGWLPNGVIPDPEGGYRFDLHGVRARLVAATLARSEVVSGWDMARRQPKPAQKLAPTGSVFWLDELQANPADLQRLIDEGLWSRPCEDAARRAEGFNRLALAAWLQPLNRTLIPSPSADQPTAAKPPHSKKFKR